MSDKAPNPYVGPTPFERNDEHPFYGRDGDLRRLAILFIAQRIVLLYSPSGAGKTSLVQARLIPALEREEFDVLPVIRAGLEQGQGTDERSEPANIFLRNTIAALEAGRESDESYATFTEYWSARRAELGDKPAVLFFDQFEEVLTVDPHDTGQKSQFFDQVGAALEADDRLWALFAIREDYLAELDPYRHLIPGKLNSSYRLELLTPDQAMDAIQKPAADYGVAFSDGAAQKLVDQLRRVQISRHGEITGEMGSSVEPVQLQIVCLTFWNDLEPDVGAEIGPGVVEAEGLVDRALGDFYDKTITEIAARGDESQRVIRDWFEQQLITRQGLRGQVMGSDDMPLSPGVISGLVDAHLVRAEERRGIQWYELAHDRLIKPVKTRNVDWYQDNPTLLRERSTDWEVSKERTLLLRGAELEEWEEWAEANPTTDVEREFLSRSRVRERYGTLAESGYTWLVGCYVWLALIFFVLALVFFILWRQAEKRELVSISAAANMALRQTLPLVTAQDGSEAIVTEAIFSPDGDLVLTSDSSGVASIWLVRSGEKVANLEDHSETIQRSAFSPDSSRIFAADDDGRVRIWDAKSGEILSVLEGHAGQINEVYAGPDDEGVLTAGQDGAARIWDAEAGEMSPPLSHESPVIAAIFSPDGRQVLAITDAGTARLWDAETQELLHTLEGHSGPVSVATFSPDGKQILIAGASGIVKIWDVETGQEQVTLAD